MRDSASEELKDGLLSLDMEATLMAANTVIKANDKATVNRAVNAVTEGLQIVGKRFQEGEWFLAELVYAGP